MYWSQDPDTRDKIVVFYRFLKDSVVVLDYEEDVAEIISVSNSIVKRTRKRRNFDLHPFLV